MTPEEICDVILNAAQHIPMMTLSKMMLQAVRAGIAEEREACARIVREHLDQLPAEIMPEDWRMSAVKRHLDEIFAAIQARTSL